MPESYADASRPTKWAALALQSRAALYAASIAEHGTEQLGGLLGFGRGDVAGYAQKSFDAANAIITGSPHALYENDADPVKNFHNLFIDESGANKEVILSQRLILAKDWAMR